MSVEVRLPAGESLNLLVQATDVDSETIDALQMLQDVGVPRKPVDVPDTANVVNTADTTETPATQLPDTTAEAKRSAGITAASLGINDSGAGLAVVAEAAEDDDAVPALLHVEKACQGAIPAPEAEADEAAAKQEEAAIAEARASAETEVTEKQEEVDTAEAKQEEVDTAEAKKGEVDTAEAKQEEVDTAEAKQEEAAKAAAIADAEKSGTDGDADAGAEANPAPDAAAKQEEAAKADAVAAAPQAQAAGNGVVTVSSITDIPLSPSNYTTELVADSKRRDPVESLVDIVQGAQVEFTGTCELTDVPYTPETLKALFDELDTDKNGYLTETVFVNYFKDLESYGTSPDIDLVKSIMKQVRTCFS